MGARARRLARHAARPGAGGDARRRRRSRSTTRASRPGGSSARACSRSTAPSTTRHREPFAGPFRLDAGARALRDRSSTDETERLHRRDRAGRARPSCAARSPGPLAAAVVTYALGLEHADVDAVLGWYDAIVGAVDEITARRPLPADGRDAYAALRGSDRASARRDGDSLLAAAGAAASSASAVISNAAVMLFGGIETTEGMIANAVLHLLDASRRSSRSCAPTRACCRRDRGVAAARAGGRGRRPLRDRATSSSPARRSARGDLVHGLDRRRQPRPGDVPRSRPLRRPPRQRAAATWRSPTARTSASGCTSRGSRPTPPSRGCSSACRACGSTGSRPRRAGWCSASRPSCWCAGRERGRQARQLGRAVPRPDLRARGRRARAVIVAKPEMRSVWIALGLFVTLWWTWIGFAVLYNRHGADDPVGPAAVPGGQRPGRGRGDRDRARVEGHSTAFAISHGAHARRARGARTGRPRGPPDRAPRASPPAAPVRRLDRGPEPWRYALWGIAIGGESGAMLREDREAKRRRGATTTSPRCTPVDPREALDPHHFAERFGLFLIILLGEVVVGAGLGRGRRHRRLGRAGRRRWCSRPRCGGCTSTRPSRSTSRCSSCRAARRRWRGRSSPPATCCPRSR